MGRAERRRIARANHEYMNSVDQMRQDARGAALYRNGITQNDLTEAFKEGYTEGHKDGVTRTYNMVYASVLLALNELFGFGQERCFRVIQRSYDAVVMELDSKAVIQDVYDRIGIELRTGDALESVVRVHPKRRKREKKNDKRG